MSDGATPLCVSVFLSCVTSAGCARPTSAIEAMLISPSTKALMW